MNKNRSLELNYCKSQDEDKSDRKKIVASPLEVLIGVCRDLSQEKTGVG